MLSRIAYRVCYRIYMLSIDKIYSFKKCILIHALELTIPVPEIPAPSPLARSQMH